MKARIFFILLLAISLYFGVSYYIDFIKANPYPFQNIGPRMIGVIVIAIVLQMIGHVIRAAKSKLLIDDIREAKASTLFKGLSVGYLFNSLLPLRLGEFIRAYYVGDSLAISKTTVFMSILIERLVDGVILSACFVSAGVLIRSYSHGGFVIIIQFGLALLAVSTILAILVQVIRSEDRRVLKLIHSISQVFNKSISDRFRFMSWSAIYGTRLMLTSRRVLAKYIAASIVMWVFYFASTICVAIAYFNIRQLNQIWYTAQSCYAAVSTPIGPGYIGTFSAILNRLLSEIGLKSISNFAVVMWFIIVTPISLIGLVVLVKQRYGEKKHVSQKEMLIHKLYRGKDISPEFSHFLDAYFNGERINKLLTQAELEGSFRLIKSFKGGSNAHTMLVWQDGEMLVKKITLPQYADKLAEQARWLIARQRLKHIPRVVNEIRDDHYYSYELNYYENYFPFFDYIHSHTLQRNFTVLDKIITFMNSSIYEKSKPIKEAANLNSYIDTKVLGKVNDTAAISGEISQLLGYKKLVVNGKSYDNILQIIQRIQNNKKAMQELATYNETPIHGDFTIDNMLVNSSGDFFVLDPNNENQVSTAVVDYAKLYQSLHSGYEFLIQLDDCNVDENRVDYNESMSQKYGQLFIQIDEKMAKLLDRKAYRSILFHEAVHYCRMLTYRANINPDTVAVFYATAVKLFNEYLDQYAKS